MFIKINSVILLIVLMAAHFAQAETKIGSGRNKTVPIAKHDCGIVKHPGLKDIDTHLKGIISALNKGNGFKECKSKEKGYRGYTEVDLRIMKKELEKELGKRPDAELELKTTQDLENFLSQRPCVEEVIYLTFLEFVKIFNEIKDPLKAQFTTEDLYWLLLEIMQNGRQWREFAKKGMKPVIMDIDLSRLNIKNQGDTIQKTIAKIAFHPNGKIVIDLESIGLNRIEVGAGGYKVVKTGLAFDDLTFVGKEKLDALPKWVVMAQPRIELNGEPDPEGVEDIEHEADIIHLIEERNKGKPVKGVLESWILMGGEGAIQKEIMRPYVRRGALTYVDGEILNIENFEKETCENQIRILSQAAEGIVNLHRLNIVHSDINGRNILLGEKGAVLTDFGVSFDVEKRISEIQEGNTEIPFDGTPDYLPFEIFDVKKMVEKLKRQGRRRIGRYLKSIDVYSFGIMLGPVELNWKGAGCKEGVRDRIQALIKDTTNKNPWRRITAEELKDRLEKINQ